MLSRHKTIKAEIAFEGYSPFTARRNKLILKPATHGKIIFYHQSSSITIDPQCIHLEPTIHASIIKNNECKILEVEHLLATLYAFGISSLDIELMGDNGIPLVDGSAEMFTKMIDATKIVRLKEQKPLFKIDRELRFFDEETGGQAKIIPSDGLELSLQISFPNLIGNQKFSTKVTKENFIKQISWARTFLRSPLDSSREKWARVRKLIPALPLNPEHSPIIVFSDSQFITKLRTKNEPVRHKALDFIGDLSLIGKEIEGSFFVKNPGHNFNQKLVLFLNNFYSK